MMFMNIYEHLLMFVKSHEYLWTLTNIRAVSTVNQAPLVRLEMRSLGLYGMSQVSVPE